MDGIKNYKCPCCSASLIYDGVLSKLKCLSCQTEFDIDALTEIDEAKEYSKTSSRYDWSTYEPRNYDSDCVDFSTYSCPSCGASVTGDNAMGATICPYCGNATIIKGQFEGTLEPDFVLPFKIPKDAVVQMFEEECAKKPFIPDEFKEKKIIQEMSGVYVPFWVFGCNCECGASYSATRVHRWHDSRYNYIKTDFYTLIRGGNADFDNVPVDASKKVNNDYTESLEPFDYDEAVTFNSAYLSGYLADKYDIPSGECVEIANKRIKNSVESELAKTVNGYATVVLTSSNVNFSDGEIRYALLPVWMLNVKYNGEMYHYEINGQTGKIAGKYPICKKKRNAFFRKVFSISLAIAAAIGFVYLGFVA